MPRPTVAVQNNKEMAHAMTTIARAMDSQAKSFELLLEKVIANTQPGGQAESMRAVDAKDAPKSPDGFAEIAGQAPPGEKPVAIFKSRTTGLAQVIKQSYKIPRGPEGEHEQVPPKIAVFENSTYRPDNEEDAQLLRDKIAKKVRKKAQVDIIELTGEVAARLSQPGTEVTPVKPEKLPDTSPELEYGKRVEVAEAIVA